MSESPKKPWAKGAHPTYTAFRLVINICQDRDGNVWSDHDFESEGDRLLAVSLPQGGAPQIAHALMTEAVRREVFLCVLIEMTKDSEFLVNYVAANDETKATIETELVHATKYIITRSLDKMVPGSVAEVLAMMADQDK